MNIELSQTKETELQKVGAAILAEVEQFRIVTTDEQSALAASMGARLKGQRAIVAELYDEPIDKAYALHKDLCTRRKTLDDPLKQAIEVVRSSVGAYESRKKAEADRLERERQEVIRKAAREAEELRQRQLAEARALEEDRRLQEAQKLADAGRTVAADAMLAAPVVVAVPPVVEVYTPPPVVYTKPADVKRTTENWKWRILDIDAVPREYMILDETKIGRVVRALKGETRIPGIEAFNDPKASF